MTEQNIPSKTLLQQMREVNESWANPVVAQVCDRLEQLEYEVHILRLYGNKSCTAQADEILRQHGLAPDETTTVTGGKSNEA